MQPTKTPLFLSCPSQKRGRQNKALLFFDDVSLTQGAHVSGCAAAYGAGANATPVAAMTAPITMASRLFRIMSDLLLLRPVLASVTTLAANCF